MLKRVELRLNTEPTEEVAVSELNKLHDLLRAARHQVVALVAKDNPGYPVELIDAIDVATGYKESGK